MITVFYARASFYVPSCHPLLYSHLKKRESEEFILIDINNEILANIKEKIKQSSLIIFDQSIIEAFKISNNKESRSQNYAYYFRLKSENFYEAVIKLIFNSNKRFVMWASVSDAHTILNVQFSKLLPLGITYLDILQRMEGLIWGFNGESLISTKTLTPDFQENWMIGNEDPKESYDLIKKYISYEVEIPHCVDESEFINSPKKWDVYIPGVKYITRKIVQDLIIANNHSTPNNHRISYWNGKFNGLVLKSRIIPTTVSFRINYLLMRNFISKSRISFVCGSSLRYFVRKFLEVPSFNSVLLAYGPANMEDYGFVDGQNYIYTRPDECLDKIQRILADKDFQIHIIEEANKNVKKLHTADVRAKDFIKSVKLIHEHNLINAKFHKGEFTYYNIDKTPMSI